MKNNFIYNLILYFMSACIAVYGLIYLYLGYKFEEFVFIFLAVLFVSTSVVMSMKVKYFEYWVMSCFSVILVKVLISNSELIMVNALKMNIGSVFESIGGEIAILILFLVFTVASFRIKKRVEPRSINSG